jgi:transcriptional regulator with XRE-family HTH domain
MTPLGERIKAERARLGMSQPAFGEIVKATKWTVWNWEKGDSAPDANQLAALAAVGLDVAYVVTGLRETSPSCASGTEIDEVFNALTDADRQIVIELAKSLLAAHGAR